MAGGGGGGMVVERKRKKKGRPSLLDLQKRSLRLQRQLERQQQQHIVPSNPSTPNDDGETEGSARPTRRRREKKLKLVLALPPDSVRCAQSSASDDGGGSAQTEKRHGSSKTMDPLQGDPSDSGPTTSLPDKMLLEFILDRLQKKDTYGVFSEPVNPEELPDYHEIIDHPMDFSTIRKKLSDGIYENLEQFEKDVFLICSNAMHYNAPDTVFFRQARAIQELAKKDFENLRQESDDCEPEAKVVRKGRPPRRNVVKKLAGRPPTEHARVDFSSDATLATAAADTCNSKSSSDDPRRGLAAGKPNNLDFCSHQGLRNNEKYISSADLRYDKSEGFSGSLLKGISTKPNRNVIISDNDRRGTYSDGQTSGCGHKQSVFAIFDGERRQLIPVGLHVEHSYARSLARFAANFGPVGWEIATRLIKKALPPGTKFGHGWVGEKDEPYLHQQPLPHVPSTDSPSQSVISKENRSMTVPPKFSPAVSDNHPVVMDSAESFRQPSYNSDFEEVNNNSQQQQQQQTDLHHHRRFPIQSGNINNLNNAPRFNFFDSGNTSRPTMLGSSMHSQVPMTHVQVLDMVGRRDHDLFNCAVTRQPESHRIKTDDLHPAQFGNVSAHCAAATCQVVERSRGHQINENSSNGSRSAPMYYSEAEATEFVGGRMIDSGSNFNHPQTITLPDANIKLNYPNTTNSASSIQETDHTSHRALQGWATHSEPQSLPPDHNIKFQSPSSSSVPVVDCQYPDLALQL